MSSGGNQYADRIFSEHPISLWSLDEEVFYLSLIDDNSRLFSNWTLSNCTYNDSPVIPENASPFNDNTYSSITANTSSAVTTEAESAELFSIADLNITENTFCVNFFLYQKPTFINWIKVGYRYNDAEESPQEVISEEISPPAVESWTNFNNVYEIPTSWSGSIKIFIQINFSDTSGGDDSSRTVILNGLSIGQGSETTCYQNLGSTAFDLPESVGIPSIQGIPADQYGILADNGYYIVRNKRLLAKNDGFPIVFGTNQSTKIYPSDVGLPSFVFPGKGMLNESGRNKIYTLEAWLKIDSSTSIAKKILGPVSTKDGLYIKEGFLTLVVGGEIASHCISEWYRPMLIHLQIREASISMLINGESVISIDYDKTKIDLPNDRDWWGVYSYPEISMFQIDSISIFPYIVSETIAKRRFVYGQGTSSIQSIDDSFFGTPTTIDFSTSEYGPSVIYPDVYRWDAGYFSNLNANRDYLSVPNYTLPIINIGGRDLKQWYEDNYQVNTLEYPDSMHPKFVTFRPNIEYTSEGEPSYWNNAGENYDEQCYFNFPSLNVLNDSVTAIYGIFEIEDDIALDRTLMSFVNVTNGDTFDIVVNSDTVSYSINQNVLHQEVIQIGIESLVGINLQSAGAQFGYEVSRFFSSPSSVQIFVGGNGENTFEGKIYIVGFSNQENYQQISDNFDSNGIAISENYEILISHIASYTLVPEYEYSQMFLDVSISSSWEEYYPLSYFAGYVKDANGDLQYDLDFMQINVGYSYTETQGVWTYEELLNSYSSEDYQGLKDSIYTNYFNLYKNNTTGETVNVSNSSMQSYITFQRVDSNQNLPLSSFTNSKDLNYDGVIYADDENTLDFPYRVYDTKFAFKDNTIVYPPKINSFEEYAMVVHFSIKQRAILKNPLKIRGLEVSSKNLNYVSSSGEKQQRNFIGTKFGQNIYPQKVQSGDVDYKAINPIAIYKTNSPYLYTTKKSGIKIINKTALQSPENEYMASISVNPNASYEFYVGALQFFVKGEFSEVIEEIKLIDINHKNGKISISVDKTTAGNFIKAYVDNGSTLTPASDISFYQNGRYVVSPKIVNNEWNAIGISFAEELDFSEYSSGGIGVFGEALFNNISYYLSKGLGIKTELNIRDWENVLNYDSVTRAWSFWDSGSQTWKDIYVLGQTSSYFNTPEDIYKAYTGTNKSIIDDNLGMMFNATESKVYTEVSWQTITNKPA
jgi:hypothetical protein